MKLPRYLLAVSILVVGCQSDAAPEMSAADSSAATAASASTAPAKEAAPSTATATAAEAAPKDPAKGSAGQKAASAVAGSTAGASATAAAGSTAAASGETQQVAAGSGGTNSASAAGSGGEMAAAAGSRLPAVMTTKGNGPFETKQNLSTGPKGQSGVFWPSELGQNGVLHPIFVWGCGGGTTPTTYAELMSTIASYGFVVIAETATVDDKGAPLKAAIDWMLGENARMGSDFFQKLDATKVGLGGHSIGSANSFLVADDPRLTTSIHVAGGSLDMAGNINAPTTGSGGKRLTHPVAYVCSESDQFGNVEKTEKDYEQTTVPAWLTVMSGVDHVGAAREGMPAIVAWLRWQLAGETERRASFLDEGGEFTTGMYVSKNKNW